MSVRRPYKNVIDRKRYFKPRMNSDESGFDGSRRTLRRDSRSLQMLFYPAMT
jgi:hypothetical protein